MTADVEETITQDHETHAELPLASSTPKTQSSHETPPRVASLAHRYLTTSRHQAAVGSNVTHIWDMCCGRGALLHDFLLEIQIGRFASTLQPQDIAIITQSGEFSDTNVFQYDFLNQSDEDLPLALLDRMQPGSKWIFILNPPFDAASSWRTGVQTTPKSTAIRAEMKQHQLQSASANLTCQFLWRIATLVEKYNLDATVGVFNNACIWTGAGYDKWRDGWQKQFRFANGFTFHSKVFAGVKGDFPVSFTIWQSGSEQKPIELDVIVDGNETSQEFKKILAPAAAPLSSWVDRPRQYVNSVPLDGALKVSDNKGAVATRMAPGSLGFAAFAGNDVRNNGVAALYSSVAGHGAGWSITKDNFEQSIVCLTARGVIEPNWISEPDQYSAPNIKHPEYQQFINDAAIWLIGDTINHSSSAILEYTNLPYELTNQFFWLSPRIMGKYPDAPESILKQCADAKLPYLVSWLRGRELSADAQGVLNIMRELTLDTMYLRAAAGPIFQLMRWDAGWWQIRRGLLEAHGDYVPPDEIAARYKVFWKRHRNLEHRLRTMVYKLGMLPEALRVVEAAVPAR